MDDPQTSLTASDRCDRCGAPAQARTMHDVTPGENIYEGSTAIVGRKPLLWCAHHFRDHATILSPLLTFMTPEIALSKEPVSQS